MKTCEEMANSVFARREFYLLKKKKRKRVFIGIGVPTICLLLVFSIGLATGKIHLSPSPSSIVDPKPLGQNIWVPDLPNLNEETLQFTSSFSSEEVENIFTTDPYFNSYEDFEHWLITSELGDNIDQELQKKYHDEYLKKWVYMWRNADYTLKTGYYYRPVLQNNQLTLNTIDVYTYSDGYRFYYRYNITPPLTCEYFNSYKFNLFVNDSQYVNNEFNKEMSEYQESNVKKKYKKIQCNNIDYHIFIGDSITDECNFIGIYWVQDDTWYYGYYLASKKDTNSYNTIVENLNMIKTPFREDCK